MCILDKYSQYRYNWLPLIFEEHYDVDVHHVGAGGGHGPLLQHVYNS